CDVDITTPSQSQQIPSSDNKETNEELTGAVALGLYDYLRKSRSKGFVLSLSGGADSATCAIMVAEMVRRASASLGWKRFCEELNLDAGLINGDEKKAVGALLTCAYQATKNSSEQTFQAAREVASSIGAVFHHWQIDDEVN